MIYDHFMALNKYFLGTNTTTYVREKDLLEYDKLKQTRWLIDSICENCKRIWKLGKMCTNNGTIFCNRGSIVHCTNTCLRCLRSGASRYGVWLILVTKFIWNFTIYCGKNKDTKKVVRVAQGGGMFGS
jgi:hypothetical protein